MTNELPKTLQEAIIYFADEQKAFEFVCMLRWPDGNVLCPDCGQSDHGFISTRRLWRCKNCKREFSVKVGTIFEDSPIKLGKWLCAIWMITNCRNGISSYEIARSLGLTQKTAWFVLHRIRAAMASQTFEKLSGVIEADETYIGGKLGNMHKDKRAEHEQGRGAVGKQIVMGLMQRDGEVRTFVIPNTGRPIIQKIIKEHVEPKSKVFTDEAKWYRGIGLWYTHKSVNHSREYRRGEACTNGIEGYWALLKRALKGTYLRVDAYHLQKYCDEQLFRYNIRDAKDLSRAMLTVTGISGKRVTYADLKKPKGR